MKHIIAVVLLSTAYILAGQNPGMVSDIHTGPTSTGWDLSRLTVGDSKNSYPEDLTVFNDRLFFTAQDGVNGRKLWNIYGSLVPRLAYDLWPGLGGAQFGELTTIDHELFFVAYNSVQGFMLWVFDGTNGPSMVTDDFHGEISWIGELSAFKGKLMYYARIEDISGVQLYEYDPANPNAVPVCLTTGGGAMGMDVMPLKPVLYDQKIYFRYRDSLGYELWEYDGISPPQLTADLWPGEQGSDLSSMMVYNDRLYFSARPGGERGGPTLPTLMWEYDGHNPPTPFADLHPDAEDCSQGYPLAVFGNKLYICGYDSNNDKSGLWEYNGIDPPVKVAHIFATGGRHAQYNHRLIFVAWSKAYGNELWEFNGVDPPEMVGDIRSGPEGSYPANLTVYDGKLYFRTEEVSEGIYREELWSLYLNVTGVRELESIGSVPDKFFHCYPNPTSNLTTIETEHSDHYSIEMTSLNGQRIYSNVMEGTTHQIDLSSFEKGVYFITIKSEDFVTTRKIIKL